MKHFKNRGWISKAQIGTFSAGQRSRRVSYHLQLLSSIEPELVVYYALCWSEDNSGKLSSMVWHAMPGPPVVNAKD